MTPRSKGARFSAKAIKHYITVLDIGRGHVDEECQYWFDNDIAMLSGLLPILESGRWPENWHPMIAAVIYRCARTCRRRLCSVAVARLGVYVRNRKMHHDNFILKTDSYKISHWKQYPPGTTRVFSYIEARGGDGVSPTATLFGLQYILMKHLVGEVVDHDDIYVADAVLNTHFGTDIFNRAGWTRIVDHHKGRLPLLIKAVPEGTTVPTGNALVTIENTDPELSWLTNYVETLLSQVWYPSTVATQSRGIRGTVARYLDETGDPTLLPFKVHDFGFRGSTSTESAGIGSAAHLLSFNGTDTLVGIELANEFYGEMVAGFSIPAAEHSTITAWGRDREVDAYHNILDQFPAGVVAVVSDSYDVFAACKNLWGGVLRDRVMARDGCLVIRPDSGDPVETVIAVLHILGSVFPVTVNDKGFKVLDPHVRVIQGDGIDAHMILRILSHMKDAGWSADNIAFGSGGGLLQKVNRDTLGFAFKTSAIEIEGVWADVYKDPVTDQGKRSKRGRLALVHRHGAFGTLRQDTTTDQDNLLVPVFENGELVAPDTFAAIRARVRA